MTQLFLIIGAQRAGTTSLAQWLNSSASVRCIGTSRPEARLLLSKDSVEEGLRILKSRAQSPGSSLRMVGEKATTYLDNTWLASEIAEVDQAVRIFVVLRDPVLRAVSHYQFSVANGLETLPPEQALTVRSEERAWRHLETSTNPYAYLSRGEYVKALRHWKRVFPNLVVIVHEQLVANPAQYVRRLVDESVASELVNKRFPATNASVRTVGIDATILRDLSNHFRSANLELESFLDVSLGHWM